MPMIILVVLAPTLAFYLYVLVQFFKEAGRRRHRAGHALIVALGSENARTPECGVREFPAGEFYQGRPVSAAGGLVKGPASKSARAKVIVAQVKSRLAVPDSPAERLALKRAAKG